MCPEITDPNVEDVDKCNRPLEHRRDVPLRVVLCDAEADRQSEFDYDEYELDPERSSQDSLIAEVDTQSLILGANEDRRHDVAAAVMICQLQVWRFRDEPLT